MIAFEELKNRLVEFDQEHLIKFWDELNDDERKQLHKDIDELNLSEVNSFFLRATTSLEENGAKLDDRLEPPDDSTFMSICNASEEILKSYNEEGLRQISESRVGVLLMAGGQGTRLGFSYPKGMYDVGLQSKKSLFKIQAERIQVLQRLASEFTGKSGYIKWYIMTSEHTMEPTKTYFAENKNFGLRDEDIVMFEQGSLPCYDFNGKIILDEKYKISKAPDGNGGLYRALRDQGILKHMQQRNVLYLHTHSVDNILIKVADPILIGYCVKQNADCGAKVVKKSYPSEAVGVVCKVDGKYQVVEYSEITSKTAELKNSNGELTFSAGNICNHYFTVSFLDKIASIYEKQLKLHVAQKKIPFIDNSGKKIIPEKPNGIKIEKFVFDVFQFAENFVTVEVPRDEEFSALKNADSAKKDCPSTAKCDIYRLHKKYIENAGGIIIGDECEISSLLSYAGESLRPIVCGKTFTSPIYLKSSLDYPNGHL